MFLFHPVEVSLKIYIIEMKDLTAFSSSSRKLRMLCCLTSALFFRDDVNDCGAHPAIFNHDCIKIPKLSTYKTGE